MTDEPRLRAIGIRKAFGAVSVLRGVDLDVGAGEIVALLGENGAGKSTLIRALAGVHRPDAGEIRVAGEVQHFRAPAEAQRAGIATIHQELSLVPSLTCAENLFLGREPRTRFGFIDRRTMRREAQAQLATLHAGLDPDEPVSALGVGLRQLLEIAKALSRQASILILDEPTSALTSSERETLFTVLRKLRTAGTGMIYVSHRLEEVEALCDRLVILRDGVVAGARPVRGTSRDEIVRMLVGREVSRTAISRAVPGDVVLRIRDLSLAPRRAGRPVPLHGLDLDVRRGEIVGLAGLLGSGRTATMQSLFGLLAGRVHGEVQLDGRRLALRSARDAVRAGIAFVPEERKVAGIVGCRSIAENVLLTVPARVTRRGLRDRGEERRVVDEVVARFGIRCKSTAQRVGELSGGNQQKVVVGKWLAAQPRLFLIDEPTRGVDVGARREIHEKLREIVGAGAAMIIASSDWQELCELCDRVLVLRGGRVARSFDATELTEAGLLAAAAEGGAA